mmetsp:Transcript_87836/g.283689  ORF Transcript_87836/g.283689 Transcript_87836/m.283689 type:complete len:216 (+) Transcript_87836:1642-2289(+)
MRADAPTAASFTGVEPIAALAHLPKRPAIDAPARHALVAPGAVLRSLGRPDVQHAVDFRGLKPRIRPLRAQTPPPLAARRRRCLPARIRLLAPRPQSPQAARPAGGPGRRRVVRLVGDGLGRLGAQAPALPPLRRRRLLERFGSCGRRRQRQRRRGVGRRRLRGGLELRPPRCLCAQPFSPVCGFPTLCKGGRCRRQQHHLVHGRPGGQLDCEHT